MSYVFGLDQVVKLSHSVKTFEGHRYINLEDGSFYDLRGRQTVPLDLLLEDIRYVFASDGRVLAKRKKAQDRLHGLPSHHTK